jgi:hypothetical protein
MEFLRDIFGPSKYKIWQQVADEIGGQFENGGFFGKDILRFRSGQWEITLDILSGGEDYSSCNRMRAPFVNKEGLKFEIYKGSIASSIGKYFGMQDIQVKDRLFDDKYIVKGNKVDRIKLLLQDENLKDLIRFQGDVYFSVRDDDGSFGVAFPRGVDELYFESEQEIKDVEQLKCLFELFSATLMRLVEIDSAFETDPMIRLN